MDQNSMPPGGTPDRPMGETPQEGQPAQPPQPQPPQQPQPGPYTQPPGYPPPQQDYPPPGYPQQPGAQQGGQQPGYPPQGYPPQGYPPQGSPGGPGYPQGYPPQGYPPQGYEQQPPPKKGGMPTWGWVVIGVVLVLIIGCVGSVAAVTYFTGQVVSRTFSQIGSGIGTDFIDSLGAIGVVTEFYDNLDRADFDSARNLLSSDLADQYSDDDLKAKWEALENAHGTITPDFPIDDQVQGDNAAMTQTLISENGDTYNIELKLQRAGDTWEITEASPGLIPEP